MPEPRTFAGEEHCLRADADETQHGGRSTPPKRVVMGLPGGHRAGRPAPGPRGRSNAWVPDELLFGQRVGDTTEARGRQDDIAPVGSQRGRSGVLPLRSPRADRRASGDWGDGSERAGIHDHRAVRREDDTAGQTGADAAGRGSGMASPDHLLLAEVRHCWCTRNHTVERESAL